MKDLSKIKFSINDVKREIRLPKISNDLAEFLGILTGDGYMNYYPEKEDYKIEITGDSTNDKEYLANYVSNLILKLFNINPKMYFRKDNTLCVVIRSKGIFQYLKIIGFKTGFKDQIGIPSWIKFEDEYMSHFVRGFADTDGCFMIKKRNYPVIKLVTKSHPLAESIKLWLNKKQITTYHGREERHDKRTNKIYRRDYIQISGRSNLNKWMNLINFSNTKHLNKIKKWGGGDLNSRHSAPA